MLGAAAVVAECDLGTPATGLLTNGTECQAVGVDCGAGKRKATIAVGVACAVCPGGKLGRRWCTKLVQRSCLGLHCSVQQCWRCLKRPGAHLPSNCSWHLHAGTYSATGSGTSCDACSSGTHAKKVGAQAANECLSCAAGTYGPSTGGACVWVQLVLLKPLPMAPVLLVLVVKRQARAAHTNTTHISPQPVQACRSACPAAPAHTRTLLGSLPAWAGEEQRCAVRPSC